MALRPKIGMAHRAGPIQKAARERLRADALAAWAEYEATGRHTAGEAMDAWLARLEAGEHDAVPPACQG